jgi:hypothetical protein
MMKVTIKNLLAQKGIEIIHDGLNRGSYIVSEPIGTPPIYVIFENSNAVDYKTSERDALSHAHTLATNSAKAFIKSYGAGHSQRSGMMNIDDQSRLEDLLTS